MRIKLELEDFRFATTYGQMDVRWLVVRVGGKPFSVCRELEPRFIRSDASTEWLDRHLIKKMEIMLGQILTDACAAIPPGTEILPHDRG